VVVSLTVSLAALAEPPVRDEADLHFAADAAFEADGGVQGFYRLIRAEEDPEHDPLMVLLRPLDRNERWATLEEAAHVVALRLDYLVEKDRSFFSASRLREVAYINAVAAEMKVTANADGSFHVGRAPENTFRLERFDALEVARKASSDPSLRTVLEVCAGAALPDSVVFQENRDFARVWGYRTAGASVAWTAHFALGPGRTRVCVVTLTYLYGLPPFFLGGARRVQRETRAGALELIERLRAYEEPIPAPHRGPAAASESPSSIGR
jgi:hypothetical protein